MALNDTILHHDCSACTRFESFFTGDSNVVRASGMAGCVEITKGRVSFLFSDPSLIEKRFGKRVKELLCGAGERD